MDRPGRATARRRRGDKGSGQRRFACKVNWAFYHATPRSRVQRWYLRPSGGIHPNLVQVICPFLAAYAAFLVRPLVRLSCSSARARHRQAVRPGASTRAWRRSANHSAERSTGSRRPRQASGSDQRCTGIERCLCGTPRGRCATSGAGDRYRRLLARLPVWQRLASRHARWHVDTADAA